ncbi:Uncharacterised protein [Mycobacteroides abscessus subsp. massiliense]|uniref:hypothetical protein n=1 Tax=Mycobacteroides abscessus TaxID=36809 RepID=UPI0009A6B9E3|nr:hypothetical protein [Mycobacteroides abscessus]SKG49849.1 Uncharacterised protein [Mycobacteroides abscessus subsp. massiliense]SKH01896.1 Uncharacterised protein [Mycobacteroides abscessus subsp. massiliense]SKH98041.1 Uncharacterised protein [Mycobacteroides abscessus subsp. massiliense]SKJ26219.1 Uncharacterised protein [Mycobacteroides abscessus subsp. massiliense]
MKIPLTITAVAAALAAVTVAGCTTAAPSPTPPTFSTLPAPGGSPKIMPAAMVLANIGWLHADGLNVTAVGAALANGQPVLIGLGIGPCHTALLVPSDSAPWIMNRSGAAPTEGVALSRDRDGYGCGRTRPGGVTTAAPALNPPLDTTARDAAAHAGVPFIYGKPACDGTAITSVVLPTGKSWTSNRVGAAPAEGVVLSDVRHGTGCTADNPTTPKGN